MENLFNGLTDQAERLLAGAMVVMAMWFAIWTWVRTKSLAPTLGAVLVGAAVVWGVTNIDTLSDEVDEDVTPYVNQGG
jgi:hypothetical protein